MERLNPRYPQARASALPGLWDTLIGRMPFSQNCDRTYGPVLACRCLPCQFLFLPFLEMQGSSPYHPAHRRYFTPILSSVKDSVLSSRRFTVTTLVLLIFFRFTIVRAQVVSLSSFPNQSYFLRSLSQAPGRLSITISF